MGQHIAHVPAEGVWVRHVLAGVDGLGIARGGNGGRFHRPGQRALYLADSDATAWAEWYRWLAEWERLPADHVPRDLVHISVKLERVADLSSQAGRRAVGLPLRMRPSSRQWTAFQDAGERLATQGTEGILYSSAARTRSRCLCVLEPGLSSVTIEGAPIRVLTPPPPPRGLRT
jgi:RES domain-containing protein